VYVWAETEMLQPKAMMDNIFFIYTYLL